MVCLQDQVKDDLVEDLEDAPTHEQESGEGTHFETLPDQQSESDEQDNEKSQVEDSIGKCVLFETRDCGCGSLPGPQVVSLK